MKRQRRVVSRSRSSKGRTGSRRPRAGRFGGVAVSTPRFETVRVCNFTPNGLRGSQASRQSARGSGREENGEVQVEIRAHIHLLDAGPRKGAMTFPAKGKKPFTPADCAPNLKHLTCLFQQDRANLAIDPRTSRASGSRTWTHLCPYSVPNRPTQCPCYSAAPSCPAQVSRRLPR